jgi:hypothetical protein
MLKNQLYLKVTGIIILSWLILNIVFSKFESPIDGYDEVGFPFIFYRDFAGKCDDCLITGFFLKEFLLNIGIVFIITVFSVTLVSKIKK